MAEWKKCSSCKKTIELGANYYVCSVSTCNGKRTGYSFCSVHCFEVHLPVARHRDAGAIEQKAPMHASTTESSGSGGPRRIVGSGHPSASIPSIPKDILIVA